MNIILNRSKSLFVGSQIHFFKTIQQYHFVHLAKRSKIEKKVNTTVPTKII